MKANYISSLLFFWALCSQCYSLNAQTQETKGSFPTQAFGLRYVLATGNTVYNEHHQGHRLVSHLRFNIIDQIGDTVFISIQPITSESDTLQKMEGIINSTNTNANELYYFMTGPKRFVKYKFKDWDVSPFTIPIKIRPKIPASAMNPNGYPLQFIGDVAIGPYVGYRWGTKTYASQRYQTVSKTLALFAAPTYIRLDPTNSTNDDTNTVFGFSFGGAFLFNLNNFQIGLTSGFDLVGGDAATTWAYQKKSWVSFAIGFDISSNN